MARDFVGWGAASATNWSGGSCAGDPCSEHGWKNIAFASVAERWASSGATYSSAGTGLPAAKLPNASCATALQRAPPSKSCQQRPCPRFLPTNLGTLQSRSFLGRATSKPTALSCIGGTSAGLLLAAATRLRTCPA